MNRLSKELSGYFISQSLHSSTNTQDKTFTVITLPCILVSILTLDIHDGLREIIDWNVNSLDTYVNIDVLYFKSVP